MVYRPLPLPQGEVIALLVLLDYALEGAVWYRSDHEPNTTPHNTHFHIKFI